MKTVINAGGPMKRVSNKKAMDIVDNETWTYCSKREWKESKNTKKSKQTEVNIIFAVHVYNYKYVYYNKQN